MMDSRVVVCYLAATLTLLTVIGSSATEKREVKECVGRHVCTTLMRYPDNYTADEGPNCFCKNPRNPPCDGEWEDNSDATLTWQHYERSHWTVQYKFCTPLLHDRICEPGERAATVTTEMKSWHPDLAEPRCRCPGHRYHINGWKRDGNQWKYFYSCEKNECREKEIVAVKGSDGEDRTEEKHPCAKILVDRYRTADKVLEVQFLCACPEGMMCPAQLKKKEDPSDLKTDEKGAAYVMNYCESNVRSPAKKG